MLPLRLFWTLGLAACLSACASSHSDYGPPVVQFAGTEGMPPPTVADTLPPGRPYVLGPFDKVNVVVFGVPELSASLQIDAAGQLALPLLGGIMVSGKTPQEVAGIIADGLRGKYVRDPQVSVGIEEVVSQVVTVSGEVKAPGNYPAANGRTLVRAVAAAQGLSEFAKMDDVVVFRTVNSEKMAALYNLRAINAGYYKDPELYPGDVVVVGDSSARRFFKDVITVAPALLTTVLTVILR